MQIMDRLKKIEFGVVKYVKVSSLGMLLYKIYVNATIL